MNSIQAEARGLLPLLKDGATVEEVRRSIAPGLGLDKVTRQYRYQIGLEFDALLLRVSLPALRSGRIRLLHRANGKIGPSPALEAEILKRLRAGQSILEVSRLLHVMYSTVRHIAARHHTANLKFGVGRRLTPAQLEEIAAALRSGRTSASIQRRLHVSAWTVLKVRGELLNDHANRRFRRSWDMDAVKKALAEGQPPCQIEGSCGIGHQVLWKLRRKLGDLVDWRHLNRRIFSQVERAAIIADIRAGISQRSIARKFHAHYQQIRRIQIEIGLPPRHQRRFTATEADQICAAIAAGRRAAEIARDVGCTPAAIWARRKKLNAVAQA